MLWQSCCVHGYYTQNSEIQISLFPSHCLYTNCHCWKTKKESHQEVWKVVSHLVSEETRAAKLKFKNLAKVSYLCVIHTHNYMVAQTATQM